MKNIFGKAPSGEISVSPVEKYVLNARYNISQHSTGLTGIIYHAALCYVLSYCVVMCYDVLYVLCFVLLHYVIVLLCIMLCCIALCYVVLRYIRLCCACCVMLCCFM